MPYHVSLLNDDGSLGSTLEHASVDLYNGAKFVETSDESAI